MAEQIKSSDLDPLPTLDYAELDDQFVPLVWETNTKLLPGTVVCLRHHSNNRVYIFECTGLDGGKNTTGLLSQFGDEEELVYRQEARINLLYPNRTGAQMDIRWVDFSFTEAESEITLRPAYTEAYTLFSDDLAQWVYRQNKSVRVDTPSLTIESPQTKQLTAEDIRRTFGYELITRFNQFATDKTGVIGFNHELESLVQDFGWDNVIGSLYEDEEGQTVLGIFVDEKAIAETPSE